MVSVLLAYATYQRCVLYSPLLSGVYWLLTGALAVYVVFAAITSKSHLLLEEREREREQEQEQEQLEHVLAEASEWPN
ncbi:hypothetical protein AK812_SmicGene36906 [Symbiodinium microadriaticum]|uniref:Uncharacterized protein n=1 Tax=Symbiodinium microadriaticum TaxID=2951 RepID=A0A1Q9CHL6_SYMMI|nr:hypothetical protein AK812_SmicGene36906 [Symbiodinium microadriaticum]